MSTRWFGLSVVGTLAVSIAFPPAGWAADEEAKKQTARKACLSGNVQHGVDLLSDLFVTTKDPVFIYNQGRCLEQNGRWEEAIHHFREYLRADKNASARDIADAEKHIADCQALLGEKAASAPTPAVAPVQKPEPAQEAPVTPKDEAPAPPAPPPTVALPAPSDQLVTNPAPPGPRPGRGLRIAGIACGVVGVGSVATAIYFYFRARSFSDKVSNQEVPNPSDETSGKHAETMQWVFYGIGGAALASGVVLSVLGWPTTDGGRSTVGIAPFVGPGLAGVSAQRAF
jgi:hypothetical protein